MTDKALNELVAELSLELGDIVFATKNVRKRLDRLQRREVAIRLVLSSVQSLKKAPL